MREIGLKIKQLRQSRKMTLQELGDQVGLSVGYLSQLERGISTIAVDTLDKIAKIFDKRALDFFDESTPSKSPVMREKDAPIDSVSETIRTFTLSTNLTDNNMYAKLVEIMPQQKLEKISTYEHVGEEFVYILEGVLTLILEDKTYTLYPGDSAQYQSTDKHNWANYHDTRLRFVEVMTPNPFYSNK